MTPEQLALKAAIGYIERNTPQLVHSEIAADRRTVGLNELLGGVPTEGDMK